MDLAGGAFWHMSGKPRARQAELAINIRAEVRALRNWLMVTRRSAETPRPRK